MRWTWGYNVLLAPAEKYTEEQGGTMHISETERGRGAYRDDPETERLISPWGSEQDFSDDGDSPKDVLAGSKARKSIGRGKKVW